MKPTSSTSETHPAMVFVFKYWAALILFVSAVFTAGSDLLIYPARIPLVLALLFGGLFSFTVVEVRAGDDGVRYRRFFAWRTIPYGEILDCGLCLWRAYGYLRVARSVRPWGELYFVAARPMFTRDPVEVVVQINRRRLEAPNR